MGNYNAQEHKQLAILYRGIRDIRGICPWWGAKGADAKTSLVLAIIRHSAPPPLVCYTPGAVIFWEGGIFFPLMTLLLPSIKIKSTQEEKKI